MEDGRELDQDLVELGNNNLADDFMDLEESGINMENTGDFSDEEFQDLMDGEMENLDTVQEDEGEITEGITQPEETEDRELLEGNEEKKKGTRKALFKQTTLAVGASKKMFAQAVLSTHKKAHGKTGKKQGEPARK